MDNIYKDKKVVIMGLGLHGGGVGAAKFFVKQKSKVLVTDLKTKNQLKTSVDKLKNLGIEFRMGGHNVDDFKNADLIIKNPDVSNNSKFLKVARKHRISIETDITIFLKHCPSYIIGVTGSKGKSTVATLIYLFLKNKFKNTYLAGNIGISALEILPKIKKEDKIVLELSSFELEDVKKSPNVAVITNILRDHLNRYKTKKEYINAKKNIFKYQNKNDILILNYNDKIVREFEKEASSKVFFYSVEKNPFKEATLRVSGKHNLSNVLAAGLTAELLGVSIEKIKEIAKKFKGITHRQELVKEIKGIKFINDSAATMPDAVVEAIKSTKQKFPESRIILIAGGQDKNLDFKQMAEEIKNNVYRCIFLPGTATLRIKKFLKKDNNILDVSSMKEAVGKAREIARKGDIVLLSPGAASFNLFKNEFDRGEKFIKSIK